MAGIVSVFLKQEVVRGTPSPRQAPSPDCCGQPAEGSPHFPVADGFRGEEPVAWLAEGG